MISSNSVKQDVDIHPVKQESHENSPAVSDDHHIKAQNLKVQSENYVIDLDTPPQIKEEPYVKKVEQDYQEDSDLGDTDSVQQIDGEDDGEEEDDEDDEEEEDEEEDEEEEEEEEESSEESSEESIVVPQKSVVSRWNGVQPQQIRRPSIEPEIRGRIPVMLRANNEVVQPQSEDDSSDEQEICKETPNLSLFNGRVPPIFRKSSPIARHNPLLFSKALARVMSAGKKALVSFLIERNFSHRTPRSSAQAFVNSLEHQGELNSDLRADILSFFADIGIQRTTLSKSEVKQLRKQMKSARN